ncbi:MAG TPA: enoyl-CoA hydratase/isomerase family protein [Terracidiphilus sp.]|nr:enoyl-CoA hydratase/isomerase family protein [Terracidiphilus sp.]
MEPEILYTRNEREGAAWAEITLNRPQKGNALTLPMLDQLEAHIAAIRSDYAVRAVVLRGNGRFFCTGGDIEAWGRLSPHEMGRNWILRGIEVLDQIASLPQPVIAGISGHALGGGLELALAADLRIGVRAAMLGMPEVGLGMIAGWTGVRRLAETIGVARARHITLLGAPIDAPQALDWGLLTALADDTAGMEKQIDQWLEKLLSNAPIAMDLTKGLLSTMHQNVRHAHASAAAHAVATEDCQEGVRAFLEKRKPVFQNR